MSIASRLYNVITYYYVDDMEKYSDFTDHNFYVFIAPYGDVVNLFKAKLQDKSGLKHYPKYKKHLKKALHSFEFNKKYENASSFNLFIVYTNKIYNAIAYGPLRKKDLKSVQLNIDYYLANGNSMDHVMLVLIHTKPEVLSKATGIPLDDIKRMYGKSHHPMFDNIKNAKTKVNLKIEKYFKAHKEFHKKTPMDSLEAHLDGSFLKLPFYKDLSIYKQIKQQMKLN